MAEEKFPEVRPGQPISASRANQEGRVLERMAGMKPGTGMHGWHGATSVQFGRTRDVKLLTFKLIQDKSPHSEARFTGTPRQYNPGDGTWKDGERKQALDIKATGGNWPNDGDLVTAYYDQKRERYIPTATDELYFAKLRDSYPGPFQCFRIRLGIWCPELHRFIFYPRDGYDDDDELYAIGIDLNPSVDRRRQYLRYGKKGWFKRVPSEWTPSGFIYVLISLYGNKIESEDNIVDCPDEVEEDPCIESSSESSSSSMFSWSEWSSRSSKSAESSRSSFSSASSWSSLDFSFSLPSVVSYSSASSSSSSSSSVFCGTCTCQWRWNGSSWGQYRYCLSPSYIYCDCLCPLPDGPGNYVGEIVTMYCE